MRGLLFTDFVDMIESRYSLALADEVLSVAGLTAGGAYTTVGVYEFREFALLVDRVVERVQHSRAEILVEFGRFHFHKLRRLYPHLMTGVNDTFALLDRADHPIHTTVTSVHAGAEVPQLLFERLSATQARLEYRSPRGLAHIAEGIVLEAAAHYKQTIRIETTNAQQKDADQLSKHACYLLTITSNP